MADLKQIDSEPAREVKRLADKRNRLEARAAIVRSIREFFTSLGFLEVETPCLINAPAPERNIDAIECGDKFLITSPELQMKRLLASSFQNIFQICHCFRKGERGHLHLPEFTMIEWYRVDSDMHALMSDCEALVRAAALAVGSFPLIRRRDQQIDLSAPWERMEVEDAFFQSAGWRPGSDPDPEQFELDLVLKVEPWLPANRPVFLTGYPASMAALARLDPKNPNRAERFELYAGGLELANGYSELIDASEQRNRFEEEIQHRTSSNKSVYPVDERFIAALESGMSACAGIAFGLDRLVMLLTSADTIDDVVAFPEGTI